MEIIQLDISGKFAHFRKYYANNTAMTYSLPPRTTIIGILAAILGKPRDSYYEDFSSDKIRIGIAIKTPIKKSFHRLNFLSVKSLGDFRKSFDSDFRGMAGNPIQTPFEVVTGLNLQENDVKYRIFISYFDEGNELFQTLKNALISKQLTYNISMGTANFNASLGNVKVFENSQIIENTSSSGDLIEVDSAVNSDIVDEIIFEKDSELMNFIEEELLPADFVANYNRELSKMNRVLYTTAGLPLKIKFSGKYYVLEGKQTIQFLD
ncbi:CRISPR-associated protein Cas5 [Flectobacillus major]|uniref:CRISPR-associated protein Cas5 n=1 Tax=Flectobacillus major TaxID=103 RepID=UPI00047C7486|nr:CRISPR-associated protein Cas5 [Flectobacillus major]